MNKIFEEFTATFLEKYWKLNPASASYQGLSQYDAQLPIPNEVNHQNKVVQYQELTNQLHQYNPKHLSPTNRTDYYLLDNLIVSKLWYLQEYKGYEWNPTSYNIMGQFHKITKSEQGLKHQIDAIYSKLLQIPAYYEAARNNLKDPTLEHTNLAIQQLKGGLSILEKDIPQLMETYSNKKIKKRISKRKLQKAHESALNSINQFINWLDNDLRPKLEKNEKRRSFVLGKKLYDKKFKLDIETDYTSQQIYDKGIKEKAEIHIKMKQITQELWPKYFKESLKTVELSHVQQLIDKLSQNHVNREEYVDAIRQQIPELEAFVKEKDLIYLDPKKPLEVRETPAYMRGVAGASISAPGPYEKNRPTYYNVTPLDNYSPEEAESYLKEYNHYILQILNIHEAVPGHYTQLIYANKAPSLIKSLFGNGTMIEGWACYVERMMLEEGYGENAPEMWLMYYKWNLREICNALIDIGVHTQGMTEKDVIDLLTNEAFQESAEAQGKWRRVSLTQVQLCSYYTGLMEIYEFREAWKKHKKDKYDIKLFHTQFLGYGSAPVKHIKTLMYEEY